MIKISLPLILGGLLCAGCNRINARQTASTNRAVAQAIVNSITGNARGSRDKARALRAQSDQLLAAKNYNSAMDKRLAILAVRGKHSSSLGALTYYAIQPLALRDMATIASHLDASSCRKYAAQLKTIDGGMPTYVAVLEHQKADELRDFARYSSDPTKWATAIKSMGFSPQEQSEIENTSPAQIEVNIGSAYDSLIQRAKQPYPLVSTMISGDPYTRKYAVSPMIGLSQFLWAKNKLERQLDIVALQERADRLEKKKRTEPLPADPFGAGALKEKNGLIYSVGPDTKDDGGKSVHGFRSSNQEIKATFSRRLSKCWSNEQEECLRSS